jgi:putative chitinase
MCISAAVGPKCANHWSDVKTVKILLNMNLSLLGPLRPLDENGRFDQATQRTIEDFQRLIQKMAKPDGRVDPGGKTLARLKEELAPYPFVRGHLSGIMITATSANVDKYFIPLFLKTGEYEINRPLRLAHFLAQVAHESYDLKYSEEQASGEAYEFRAKKLGNFIYGDGKQYKGRGLIQLTGRNNYTLYSEEKIDDYISEAGSKRVATDAEAAVDVSCWFWQRNGLNALADQDDVMAVTKVVNGGWNGLDHRKDRLRRAKFFLLP